MASNKQQEVDGSLFLMLSRPGKSTKALYMAFQNKDDNQAESKVAQIIYRGDKKNQRGDQNGVEEVDSSDDEVFKAGLPADFKKKIDRLDKQGNNDIQKQVKQRQKDNKKKEVEDSQAVEKKRNYIGLTKAQILNEKKMEARRQSLELEMERIEKRIEVQNMSETKKIRRAILAETSNPSARITKHDVLQKRKELNQKNLTSNFVATSRDRHQYIFRNKTEPPDAGNYHKQIMVESVESKTNVGKMLPEQSNAEKAKERRVELNYNNQTICDNLVKVISTTSNMKRAQSKSTNLKSQATVNLKIVDQGTPETNASIQELTQSTVGYPRGSIKGLESVRSLAPGSQRDQGLASQEQLSKANLPSKINNAGLKSSILNSMRNSIDDKTSLPDHSEKTMETPSVGTVTARMFGSKKKSLIYDNIVGHLPNGRPLNIRTHNPNIKIIAPPISKTFLQSVESRKSSIEAPRDLFVKEGEEQLQSIQLQSPPQMSKTKSKGAASRRLGATRNSQGSSLKTYDTGYESIYKSQTHHLVASHTLEKDKLQILPNTMDYINNNLHIDRHPQSFKRYITNRHPLQNNANEMRFENINKSPDIYSKTHKYTAHYEFDKMAPRDEAMYNINPYQIDYDKKDKQKNGIMKRLDNGVVKFQKQQIRQIGEGFGGYYNQTQRQSNLTISSCDEENMLAAQMGKINARKRSVALASIEYSRPRDLLLYRQTDMLKNIELENSKDTRARQIDRMKQLRMRGRRSSNFAQILFQSLESQRDNSEI